MDTPLARRGRARGLGRSLLAAVALTLALPAVGSAAPSLAVFARGLDNPRQLALAADGTLYVAAAGSAGRQCMERADAELCIGYTGKVVAISPQGATRTVAGKLLSVGGPDGTFATGPDGVAVAPDGTVVTVITSGTPADVRSLPRRAREQAGQLLKVAPGRRVDLAAIDRFEWRNNSDGVRGDRNSNPYAVLALGDRYVVADAGANAVVQVRGRRVSLLAAIPRAHRAQRVPSSLALGPDGAIYVGELAEGAGSGKARVLRIPPRGGRATTYASGFTGVTGVAFGPDGSLYVTELTTNFRRRSAPGAVVRVRPDGTRTRFTRGLTFPQGLAVAPNGDVFVSNFSVLPASTPRRGPFRGAGGQVVRIRGL